MRGSQLAALGLLGVAVGVVVGAVAIGGDTKTETATQVVTTIKTNTRTVGKGSSSKVRTVTRTRTVTTPAPSSAPGETGGGRVRTVRGTQVFTGKGFKRLGTIKVPKRSVLEWTNDGRVFSVISQSALHVSSTKKKGTAPLYEGTYPDFRVAAVGHWTVKIVPR
jgi:hypothetical protein